MVTGSGAVLLAISLAASGAATADPLHTPGDLDAMRRWIAARLGASEPGPPPAPSIEVLANYGPVQANSRAGRPLCVGDVRWSRGLYCHAPSRLVVRLSAPAARFVATAGVDSNDQTSGGRGSVVFAVRQGGAEIWRSGRLIEGANIALDLPLGGTSEFELFVEDGGDGIACDQADWAEAEVLLRDGRRLALGDLALYDHAVPVSTEPPFSFALGGRPSVELLPAWTSDRATEPIDAMRRRHTVTYRDPETGLVVRLVAVEYLDFPTVEWTVYLRNDGAADTPLLTDVRPLDVAFERHPGGEFVLHRIRGDDCTERSYAPLEEVLPPEARLRSACSGGRPTQGAFPYFHLAAPGAGWIVALGWPGQWSVEFARDGGAALRLAGGQETTHFVLHPGEEVRTPLVALQFTGGDRLAAQNVWRRWMVAHNLPRPGGKPIETRRSVCNGNFYPSLMTVGATEAELLRRQLAAGIGFDCWWQDAGWYPCDGVGWPKTGTWAVDPMRFPGGLRAIADEMHAAGKRVMVWFEPERVHAGTELADEHPDWVHGGRDGGLLELGDPDCRAWLTDRIDRLMREQGIDDYRQDFNIDPLPYWQAADAPDRQGITEIRHVEGYLAFLDELGRRHPEALMDSCASGGRRNDLETMRRMVPLLRSDWYWSPEGQQCLTFGLSQWLPYQGTGVIYEHDAYWWRSSMVAEMSFGPDGAGLEGVDLGLVRNMVAEHRLISPCFLGDFYPLTPYSLDNGVWMAWQFDLPSEGRGVVQVFRRPGAIYDSAQLPLHGLDPTARYRLIDLEGGAPTERTGAELAAPGLRIEMPERGSARTWVYERAAPREGR